MIMVNRWSESSSLEKVADIRTTFQKNQLPLFKKVAGDSSGSYINEGDLLEADFVTAFFGSKENYARLSQVKEAFDPDDLFIVPAGVGSERWDAYGLCRV
jgi:hypothetical protein